jgi:hypothetical protein
VLWRAGSCCARTNALLFELLAAQRLQHVVRVVHRPVQPKLALRVRESVRNATEDSSAVDSNQAAVRAFQCGLRVQNSQKRSSHTKHSLVEGRPHT